jgi:phytoene synthase
MAANMSCFASRSRAVRCSKSCSDISTARSTRSPKGFGPFAILADPERQLALSYAPPARREALGVLWALDERMGAIVAAAGEPAIGAMRLVWWRDALIGLDRRDAPVPAEPLLAATAERLLPAGLSGEAIAAIEEGWSALLDAEEPGEAEIAAHAAHRGAPLFALAAALLGASLPEDVARAGEGWALADLGHRLRGGDARRFARARARSLLAQVDPGRWPAALRPLGLLTVLARADAAMPADRLRRQGSPKRMFRALAYRLTGR